MAKRGKKPIPRPSTSEKIWDKGDLLEFCEEEREEYCGGKRLTFDCFSARCNGEKVVCGKGHDLVARKDGSMSLLAVLRGRTSRTCLNCQDFNGEDKPLEFISDEQVEKFAKIRVRDTALLSGTANALWRNNIETIGELIQKSPEELLELRMFGGKKLADVRDLLSKMGIRLKGDI